MNADPVRSGKRYPIDARQSDPARARLFEQNAGGAYARERIRTRQRDPVNSR